MGAVRWNRTERLRRRVFGPPIADRSLASVTVAGDVYGVTSADGSVHVVRVHASN
jgi:hypothetical protein